MSDAPCRNLSLEDHELVSAGFIFGRNPLKMLLTDGCVWSYSSFYTPGWPAGQIHNPRTDFTRFSGARIRPGGEEFAYLGTELGGYSFGFLVGERRGLYALRGTCGPARCVDADEAFGDLAASGVL